MRTKILSATLAICATLLCACSTYKPGAAAKGTVQSIWVAPAINQSYMPQVATILSERVRVAFLEDNLVRLVRRDVADAKLEITVLGVEREGHASGVTVVQTDEVNGVPVQSIGTDNGLYKAFDVTLSARVVLTDNATGEVLVDQTFKASVQSTPNFILSSSADEERLLMPILARDLARQIHDAIAQRWDDPRDNG
ncbi:MAG: LPS assembly lipoprotein LptE [Opitutales bacterium]|jgi:hypothetical protein